MMTKFLIRGMFAGLVAGLLGFGFAKTFGEPQVDRAIAFESKMDQLEGKPEEPELVSRKMQSSIGLFTAVIVYGTGIGGLFSLAFAIAYGRVSSLSIRAISLLVAAAGFLTFAFIPFLKYPPNPPSVGQPETIGFRTETYFLMIVTSLLVLSFSIWLYQRLRGRLGNWNASLISAGIFTTIIAAIILLLPDINEVPEAFSATVLWHFRLASLGTQTILWSTLGLLFGFLTDSSQNGPEIPLAVHPNRQSTP